MLFLDKESKKLFVRFELKLVVGHYSSEDFSVALSDLLLNDFDSEETIAKDVRGTRIPLLNLPFRPSFNTGVNQAMTHRHSYF